MARKFTSFPGGDVSAMSVSARYISPTGCLRTFVYAADGASGAPGTLLFMSTEFTLTSGMTTAGWRDVTKYGGGSTSIDAGDLWLGVWFGGDAGTWSSCFDSTAGGTGYYGSDTYSSTDPLDSTWSYGATPFNKLLRIYVTYSTQPTWYGLTVIRDVSS
jgi:hypothetical protein